MTEPSDPSEMCVRIHFEHFGAENPAILRKQLISAGNVGSNSLGQAFGSLEISERNVILPGTS